MAATMKIGGLRGCCDTPGCVIFSQQDRRFCCGIECQSIRVVDEERIGRMTRDIRENMMLQFFTLVNEPVDFLREKPCVASGHSFKHPQRSADGMEATKNH